MSAAGADVSSVAELLTPKPTKRQRQANIITLDIERLPGLARLWDPRTRYVPPSSWVRWPSMLCVAWKRLGQRAVEFASVWDDGREGMARRIWDAVDAADAIVTYNGVRFDLPHMRSEWIELGMPMPRPHKDIDLYREVKRSLGFESKSLQQVTMRLGVPGKTGAYSMDEAEAAANGDMKAQQRLERYNKGDVTATEAAYLRMLGWLPAHPILGTDTDEIVCTQCGSTDLKANGWYRAVVMDYRIYRCQNCAANVRSGHSKRVARTRGVR